MTCWMGRWKIIYPNCKCGHWCEMSCNEYPNCMRHSPRRLYHPTANENMKCYDDSCDLSGSLTWFLLSRSQDTSICIPNFEPEKMSGPAVRVGAGWPRKMPCWHPRHRASWAREKNWSVFIGRLCWQGNVAGVCFFNFLFPLVHELRHDFWRCFFSFPWKVLAMLWW